MKLRTFTALLLAAIMLFALTACGSQAADDSSNDQQQEQQDTTTNESNEFRVGMECAYAPNNWQESEATDSNVPVENVAGAYAEGYDVQIAKAIADGLGKELVIVKLSWDGSTAERSCASSAHPALANRRCCAASTYWKRPTRATSGSTGRI